MVGSEQFPWRNSSIECRFPWTDPSQDAARPANSSSCARARLRSYVPVSNALTSAPNPITGGWSTGRSLLVLLIATAFVALMSEFLVGVVEEAAKSFSMTEVFVGVILVAIIGNAAEHSTTVLMSIKNKMDIAISIAVGSSIQIALSVALVMVFLSNFIGPRPMDLIFTNFEGPALPDPTRADRRVKNSVDRRSAGLVRIFLPLDPVVDDFELSPGIGVGLQVGEQSEPVLLRGEVGGVDAADRPLVDRAFSMRQLE